MSVTWSEANDNGHPLIYARFSRRDREVCESPVVYGSEATAGPDDCICSPAALRGVAGSASLACQ